MASCFYLWSMRSIVKLDSSVFSWSWTKKPVTISKVALQKRIFLASGMRFKADLEQSDYVLVPDMAWMLNNCPKSKPWQKGWNCTKIAVRAWAGLQTHAVGLIKVSWRNGGNHTLLLVALEDGVVMLFNPQCRQFYSLEGRKIYRLWM